MRLLFCIIVLWLTTEASVFAQQARYSSTDKKAIEHFLKGNSFIDEHLYDDALLELQTAIKSDSKFTEAYALLGDLYRIKRQHSLAITNFQKVITLDPEYNRAIYLKLGDSEISDAKYSQAQQHLEKYLTYADISAQNKSLALKLVANCKFAINAMQHPVIFKPINMGAAINTANDEYLPVATADEAQLIFTRKINNNEDFYKSIKQDDQWQPAVSLSDVINTPKYNEGAQSISQDGKYLFFTGCNRPDGLGRCDIYIARKDGNDWKEPFSLSAPINTAGWEAQPSISADGRTLYFVSNRKGGYGGYDIWKSKLTEKGWGEPENMGPNVNTPYDEQSPFIHPDDNTFYFCSSGWPGMGGRDLFVTRMGKDGQWQKPENLGYPINSSGDENGLTLTANGAYAFFSSDNLKGFGGFDIYTFEMPAAIRPNIVTYVKGKVADIKTKQPLEAAVEIIDLQKDVPVYQDYSSEDAGAFLATLPAGKNYGLNISREGYLFYSDNFSLIDLKDNKAFNISVLLSPIEVGNKVILKNIFFDTNKFDLKDESKSELQKLIEFLNLNPTIKIEISGYTDDIGDNALNVTLSENRAKAVYQYLTAHQVNASRLVYKGYGKSDPIVPNNSDDNRSKNRRTEFKIISK